MPFSMSRRSFASYHATNNVSPFFYELKPFSYRIGELLELIDNSSLLAKQHGITWLWPCWGALKVHSHILGTSFLLRMSPSTRDSHVGHQPITFFFMINTWKNWQLLRSGISSSKQRKHILWVLQSIKSWGGSECWHLAHQRNTVISTGVPCVMWTSQTKPITHSII